MECPPACHHLIEHRAKAEDVGPCIHLLALGLLGRHVGDGPDDGALFRGRLERPRRRFVGGCGGFGELRQPEVEHLHQPMLSYHHIAGLQVSVNDPCLVRRYQRIGNLHRVLERLIQPPAMSRDAPVKCFPRNELHGDEVDAVG